MSNAPLTGALWGARRLLVGAAGAAAAVALAAATVVGVPAVAGALPSAAAVRPATADARPKARPGKRSAKRPARSATKSAAKRSTKSSSARSAKRGTKAARRATSRSARHAEARAAARASARSKARAATRSETRREARPAVSMAALTAPIPVVTLGAPTAVRAAAGEAARVAPDTLAGRSGKLRARWGLPSASGLFTYLRRVFGDSATAPGVYHAPEAAARVASDAPRPFTYIAMLPFAEKVGGRIGAYRIGFWPGELGRALRGDKYDTPAGFIQVTADNAETAVSEHFRLRDFLTHDQARVWPKYLVLDPALVDKLELVIDDLRSRGYQADRLHVMSGFRTPQYNRGGGDPRGRAELSRHQYGDAADVWVENGDGTMADLTGDGRVDARDAAVLAESAERVEARHPELVGGVGVYRATGAHGPFVHIDTRGERARWGRG